MDTVTRAFTTGENYKGESYRDDKRIPLELANELSRQAADPKSALRREGRLPTLRRSEILATSAIGDVSMVKHFSAELDAIATFAKGACSEEALKLNCMKVCETLKLNCIKVCETLKLNCIKVRV
jgi:hypothetical protein